MIMMSTSLYLVYTGWPIKHSVERLAVSLQNVDQSLPKLQHMVTVNAFKYCITFILLFFKII